MLSKIMLLILFMLISIPILSFSCPVHQKEALLHFKSLTTTSTTSEQLDTPDSWNSANSDCCTWHGVQCHFGAVTELFVGGSVNPVPLLSDILTPLFHIRSLKVLHISGYSLRGCIPKDGFGNLTELLELTMIHNNFMCSIPEEIGKLTKLMALNLVNNQLTGGIPSSIIHLKELEILLLSRNSMQGGIPPCIGSWLPKMTMLDLSRNQFTGPIPSSIQNMSHLYTLKLQHNKLAGDIPTSLFNISTLEHLFIGGKGSSLILNKKAKIVPRCSLQHLYMTSCGISGQIPEWISSQLRSLHILDLSMNHLEGKFPDMLIQTSLTAIILSDNSLTGSIPPGLFESEVLRYLILSRNHFSGELPTNIGNAKQIMTMLMLSGNNLSGPLPMSMSNMYDLDFLDLSRNIFSGDNFPVFRHQLPDIILPFFTRRTYFDFSFNHFFGKIPTSFPTSTRLLSLGGNWFSGDLPLNLTNLVNLKILDLHGNNITGKLQDVFPVIPMLQVLNLRENSLEGFIPKRISKLSSLQILDLSRNNLTGSIPQEIANLERMVQTPNIKDTPFDILAGYVVTHSVEMVMCSGYSSCLLDEIHTVHLQLNDDFLEGIAFHDLIVNWKNSFRGISSHSLGLYSILDLSVNRISGEIPPSLGNLKSLKELNISHNNISGHIPVSFGNLQQIETLALSHNNISGSIPESLEKLDQMAILDVSNNRLIGRIPMGGHMSTMLEPKYYANNSGLCGMQIRITCREDIQPPKEKEKDANLSLIIWEGTWVGFPVGFFSSILMWGYLLNFLQFFKFW